MTHHETPKHTLAFETCKDKHLGFPLLVGFLGQHVVGHRHVQTR